MEGVNRGQGELVGNNIKRTRSCPDLGETENIDRSVFKRSKTVSSKLNMLAETEKNFDTVFIGLNQNLIEDGKGLDIFRLSPVARTEGEPTELDVKEQATPAKSNDSDPDEPLSF